MAAPSKTEDRHYTQWQRPAKLKTDVIRNGSAQQNCRHTLPTMAATSKTQDRRYTQWQRPAKLKIDVTHNGSAQQN